MDQYRGKWNNSEGNGLMQRVNGLIQREMEHYRGKWNNTDEKWNNKEGNGTLQR